MASFEDFATLFAGSIRAQLDWDALTALGVEVSQQATRDVDRLGRLRTVWYVDDAGRPAEWDDAGARSLTVRQAAQLRTAWPPERTRRIDDFGDCLRQTTEPQVLLLPTYRIGRELLLLDASHRVVAGYVANADMRALLMTIEGPPSAELLPDLSTVVNSEA